MRWTLLEMSQNILSALNSDEVNSISDTTESSQVAEILRTSYFNIVGRYNLPEHNQLIQLDPSNDSARPVLMYRPDGVNRIEWVKYFDSNAEDTSSTSYSHGLNVDLVHNANEPGGWSATSSSSVLIGTGTKTFTVASGLDITAGDSAYVASGINTMVGTVTSYSSTTLVLSITIATGSGTYSSWTITEGATNIGPGYKYVKMVPLHEFLDLTNQFNLADSETSAFSLVVTNESSGDTNYFTFYYKNNKQPQYCAVISDSSIIFDSYDSTQDTTLQSSKTLCSAWMTPSWTATDNFIPTLDEQMFPLLLNEAKSLAFLELKQMAHPKAEKEVSRQLSSLQKYKAVFNKPTAFQELPNFGRK